ncbi:MAG: YCF48-related protein [Acidobacteriota bacterium]|nr:YCF48-related protein [Acidobacteriota bacterium]
MNDLPKIVRERLRSAEGGTHPEPNLLNAFAEHALSETERVHVLAHLSRCGECREAVFLAQPEFQEAHVTHAHSQWLGWRSMRWAAAAACVVVVAAAVSLRHQRPEAVGPAGLSTDSVPQSPRPASSAAGSEPNQNSAEKASGVLQRKEAMARAPREGAGKVSKLDDSRDSIERLSASPPPSRPQVAEQRADEKKALEKDEYGDSAPTAKTKATGAWNSAQPTTETAPLMNKAVNQAMIASPAALAPQWRLSGNGSPQRFVQASGAWETVLVSPGGAFLAIFSLGNEVWVGGANAALYHSSDAGLHWSAIKPMTNGEFLKGDVTAIEFVDPQHGKLTTANEEVWTTEDAGQSWQRD